MLQAKEAKRNRGFEEREEVSGAKEEVTEYMLTEENRAIKLEFEKCKSNLYGEIQALEEDRKASENRARKTEENSKKVKRRRLIREI